MSVRRKHIRQLAQEILDENRIDRPFVDVKKIAKNVGLKVVNHPAKDDSMSGFLDRRRDPPIIGVNSGHSSDRMRFTIAHELGHYFLHGDSLYYDDRVLKFRDAVSSTGTDSLEVEANLFAAELLMPLRFLEVDIEEFGVFDINNDKQMASLAKRYKVSKQALGYRLNYLDLLNF